MKNFKWLTIIFFPCRANSECETLTYTAFMRCHAEMARRRRTFLCEEKKHKQTKKK